MCEKLERQNAVENMQISGFLKKCVLVPIKIGVEIYKRGLENWKQFLEPIS